jgi:hypothetical protein
MKNFTMIIALFFVFLGVTAQEIVPVKSVASWFLDNWYWLVIVLTELFLRLWPTERNYSIVSLIMKVINTIFPNRKFETVPAQPGSVGNEVVIGKFGL